MRECGILLPIFSLPSEYGIGSLGKEAYRFIDQMQAAKQHLWQVLPIGPTGYGDSPYQSFSVFAGNPYLIDLGLLCEEGLLREEECCPTEGGTIDYGFLYRTRLPLLERAFQRFPREQEAFADFLRSEREWLDGYAEFAAVKRWLNGAAQDAWPEELRLRREPAWTEWKKTHAEEILFQKFLQYCFFRQWSALKRYANNRGIRMIGDLPIYTAYDSAEVWLYPELFCLDEARRPLSVAGCPPDDFSTEGQLWGNPLYDWAYHQKTGYAWWIRRMRQSRRLFDIIRIDHFRGFSAYYSIPCPARNAVFGHWEEGPGIALFDACKKACPGLLVIAEDLGFLDEAVCALRERCGFPGMKVLQFAFDPREESDYLPHNYEKNCVVYTGTHDNNTAVGWAEETDAQTRAYARAYMGLSERESIARGLVRLALASVAEWAVIPMQDYLEEGSSARINTPSTAGGNWKYRLQKGQITPELIAEMADLAKLYGRCGKDG